LNYLGVVSHIGKSGLLTIRAAEPPRIGSRAVIKGRGPIGTIIDVFGPVSKPYVSVKLWQPFPLRDASGTEIFVEEKEFRGRRFGGRDRDRDRGRGRVRASSGPHSFEGRGAVRREGQFKGRGLNAKRSY